MSHPSDNEHMLGPHSGGAHSNASAHMSNHNQGYQYGHNMPQGSHNNQPQDPYYSFPAEIFEDWNWAFDFTQTSR